MAVDYNKYNFKAPKVRLAEKPAVIAETALVKKVASGAKLNEEEKALAAGLGLTQENCAATLDNIIRVKSPDVEAVSQSRNDPAE